MSANLLLDQLHRMVTDSDAIERLRQYALSVAMTGRLLENRADAEPASVLLHAINSKREELIGDGRLRAKRSDYGALTAGDDFDLPRHWVRTVVNETCELRTGATPSRDRADFFGGDIPWLVSGDVNQGEIFACEGRITQLGMDSSNCKWLPPGAVLMALNGQGRTRGTVALLRIPATCNQSLVAIIPVRDDCLLPEYLFWNLRSRYHQLRGLTGEEGDRRGLNMRIISCLTLPLPPLDEQHRIVTKVGELMALCDQLEAAQEERETRRDAVRSVSLHRLVLSSEGNTESDTRFFLGASRRLITKAQHVTAVRRSMLHLAIRGMLVPQDPSDEPAEQLLDASDQVRAAISVRDRRAREEKQEVMASDLRWDVPPEWQWRGLADLALFIDYRGRTPAKINSGVRLVTAKNVRMGYVSVEPQEFVSEDEFASWMTRGMPADGDVLFTTEAPMGNAAVVRLTERFALAQRVINLRLYGSLDPDFLVLQILAEPFQRILDATATGLTAKGIKAAKLKRLPIVVPPLAEQRRIVAKVAELMVLCDELATTLAAADSMRGSLLDTILRQALEGATDQAVAGDIASAV